MRIPAFRVFFDRAVDSGLGAARRTGRALSRRIQHSLGTVDLATGVGEDESSFGRSGSRVWLEILERSRLRILEQFERSRFDRYFTRAERALRRWLGRPLFSRGSAQMRSLESGLETDRTLSFAATLSDAERDHLLDEIKRTRLRTHTEEHAGLREHVAGLRRTRRGSDEPN